MRPQGALRNIGWRKCGSFWAYVRSTPIRLIPVYEEKIW
jgi:hypothetical protein